MQTLRQSFTGRTASRHWLSLLGGGGLLCFLLLGVIPFRSASSQPHLRVMTYNIDGRMADPQRLVVLIHQQQPDLLMLQEVRHRRQLQWLATRLHLPYWHFAPYRRQRGGIGLLSRWRLGPAQTLAFRSNTQGKVALAAQVYAPTKTLWACSVHLDSPRRYEIGASVPQRGRFLWREVFAPTPRYRQVRELRAWLLHLASVDWIVGGDFNTIPFSRVDRYLSSRFDDVLSRHPWRYLTGTYWKLRRVLFKPRIDFIYHSPGLQVIKARVIQRKVSDHFPILAVMSSPSPSDATLSHNVKAFAAAPGTAHHASSPRIRGGPPR